MSLDIGEIGVRVTVGDVRAPRPDDAGAAPALTPAQRQEIVQECVRAVLQTLRMREGR